MRFAMSVFMGSGFALRAPRNDRIAQNFARRPASAASGMPGASVR